MKPSTAEQKLCIAIEGVTREFVSISPDLTLILLIPYLVTLYPLFLIPYALSSYSFYILQDFETKANFYIMGMIRQQIMQIDTFAYLYLHNFHIMHIQTFNIINYVVCNYYK